MNIIVTALGFGLILGNGLLQLQQGASQTVQAASQQASSQSPTVQQIRLAINSWLNGAVLRAGSARPWAARRLY